MFVKIDHLGKSISLNVRYIVAIGSTSDANYVPEENKKTMATYGIWVVGRDPGGQVPTFWCTQKQCEEILEILEKLDGFVA